MYLYIHKVFMVGRFAGLTDFFLLSADVWSVGCIMAELLTGQILFPGSDCIPSPHTESYIVCSHFSDQIFSEVNSMFPNSLKIGSI